MNMQPVNPFTRFWSLGYRRLVPIIPPSAPISERSSLFKRLQRGDDARGKMPGVKWPDGTWSGFDFVSHESTETDLARWWSMGAGVGVKTGNGLALIDADALDAADAATIRELVEANLGHLPRRIGRAPKAGYLVRVEGDFRYARVEFGPWINEGKRSRLRDRVEVLYEGRQFVADGVHPVTGTPYEWPDGVPRLADVPLVSGVALNDLLEALAQRLPSARPVHVEGGGDAPEQSTLLGDWEAVQQAVRATPNRGEAFEQREGWLAYGYALKAAAGPEHEREAKDLWLDWCARWEDGDNESDVAEADWSRMQPPFRRGARWLFETAERESGGAFAAAEAMASRWFEEPAEPLFPDMRPTGEAPGGSAGSSMAIRATAYDFPAPWTIPRRQLLYGSHYVRQFVSTTAAPTKVGKTSLQIAEALAMASGKPLLGVPVRMPLRVWLWNGEDPIDELRRRVAATMLHYGLTREDLVDGDGVSRLFLDSGRDMEIVLATSGRDGTRIAEPVEAAVMATIEANRLDVLSVDPFVSSHRVPENDNGGIDMVAKRWAKIAGRTGAAIELIHHVRKLNGGEVTIEDARGASALISAARSARALARMTKAEGLKMGLDATAARRLFRFADAQSNLALPGGEEDAWLQLVSVPLGNGLVGDVGSGSAEGTRGAGAAGLVEGDSVGVVALWAGRPAADANAAEAVCEADALARIAAGEWRRDVRAGDAWAGVPVAIAYGLDLDDEEEKGRARAIVSALIKAGKLREVTRPDRHRSVRTFVEVAQTADNLSEDVFS